MALRERWYLLCVRHLYIPCMPFTFCTRKTISVFTWENLLGVLCISDYITQARSSHTQEVIFSWKWVYRHISSLELCWVYPKKYFSFFAISPLRLHGPCEPQDLSTDDSVQFPEGPAVTEFPALLVLQHQLPLLQWGARHWYPIASGKQCLQISLQTKWGQDVGDSDTGYSSHAFRFLVCSLAQF